MILKDKLLIISYIPYVHKEGGFCIAINSKNDVRRCEIELSKSEIDELIKTPIQYTNKVPNYLELLDRYFDEQLNFEL